MARGRALGGERGGQRMQDRRSGGVWAALGLFLFLTVLGQGTARAGGPRFVTGSGIWVPSGNPEGWAVSQLAYFTDPGALSGSVNHAQADAMVAAAAVVWNAPTSRLTLAQGGQLAEHVSSANTYFDGAGVVFPADVKTSNEAAMPVAVIYDTDGSITDLLLGSGASDPEGCRQSAVTESVDDIGYDGVIHHAVVVLNGRCVGSAPEQLTQMQYQLARAFGRVLGLAWSQTNDNVFTGVSTVSVDQLQYWPLMHPLDVICGRYTYQCMPNPFTLRVDDLSSLALLYGVSGNVPGKQASTTDAVTVMGSLSFPNGQGMAWANVTAHRQHWGYTEAWETVSGVSGFAFQQALSNPVSRVQATNEGTGWGPKEGYFFMPAVPVDSLSNVFFTTEAINPLYTGEYALAPYVRPPVTPSGSAQTSVDWSATGGTYIAGMTAYDAPASCTAGNGGSEGAPAGFDPSGWQNGTLCSWGATSWTSAKVRAGHSWTLEVTATDEAGAASLYKTQPVVGVWGASDPTGTLPTVASQAVPFNSMSMGMTQVRMDAPDADQAFRFAVSDQFGAGRPDFTYTARMLYADTVTPAAVGAGGGTITITGTGFRRGNVVEVNGVRANVSSWTATQIVAIVPGLVIARATTGTPVAIAVIDPSTSGSTSIEDALTYTDAPDLLQKVSAPTALETGITARVPFAVQVLASDGVTPLAGATVALSGVGPVLLGACSHDASCTVLTDANGLVQTSVSGLGTGTAVITATEVSGGATVQVSLTDTDPVRSAALTQTDVYVAAGSGGSWTVQLSVTVDGAGAVNAPVVWTGSGGVSLGAMAAQTGANGFAAVQVSASTMGPDSTSSVTGCVWGNVCVTWSLHGVDSSQWRVAPVSGAVQTVAADQTLEPVVLSVTDPLGHVIQGAPVTVYQRVLAWEQTCADEARCAAAPVLASTQQNELSDVSGTLTVTPLQVAGVPQTVQVAASTGTEGFTTMTLLKRP